MFKKPLSHLKTTAPLRTSDRRKLKQRAVASYGLTSEEGDLLVPDGILSVKFITHVNEPGVAYIDPQGDPLWFTIGKGQDGHLIPTIYTLWKKQDLLPFVSTPSAVVPILIGGADLMIPGVIHCPPSLPDRRLVSIRQYSRQDKDKDAPPSLSPPVAVGWLALPSDQLRAAAATSNGKGKAVLVAHTWKDHLWDMGSKTDMPEVTVLVPSSAAAEEEDEAEECEDDVDEAPDSKTTATAPATGEEAAASPPPPSALDDASTPPPEAPTSSPSSAGPGPSSSPSPKSVSYAYTPAEISHLLALTLLQAISTSLRTLPSSSFPIPATQFYSTYILPSRPAFPWLLVPPSGSTSSSQAPSISENEGGNAPVVETEITIKTSTHKSLTAFLKSAEKSSSPPLLSLKPAQQKGDVVITSINASHPSVVSHQPYVTVRDVEAKKARRAEKEVREREREKGRREVEVRELWKAGAGAGAGAESVGVRLVEGIGGNKNELYTASELRSLLNAYIASHNLVNPREQAYINLDDLLHSCVSSSSSKPRAKSKSKASSKGEEGETAEEGEDGMDWFMKRDELVTRVLGRMQAWYEIRVDGRDVVTKKGILSPIKIHTKMRQGRKACTLVTGFEPFRVVEAEEMAEALRRVCAGATSVSPIPGKTPGSGQMAMEVLVQGKQAPAVVEYLMGRGVPKRWIEVVDSVGKK